MAAIQNLIFDYVILGEAAFSNSRDFFTKPVSSGGDATTSVFQINNSFVLLCLADNFFENSDVSQSKPEETRRREDGNMVAVI